jgi:hypothetical protein
LERYGQQGRRLLPASEYIKDAERKGSDDKDSGAAIGFKRKRRKKLF